MFAYALTIFVGAFLLFQVQPLIGKYILPWFGGGPGVWTTCMLFFQLLLLGGYAYAHLLTRWLRPRAQIVAHFVLLAAAVALLPITPADSWKPHSGEAPVLHILALLAACLGLPYFLLSATSPLLQHWFSRTHPARSPYRLYALSNVGSLLALVSYPFYFETHFTRQWQAGLWGWGLVVFVICCGFCAWSLWRAAGPATQTPAEQAPTAEPRPSLRSRLLWLLLPACASVLLLATTNKLCQDVAVTPFLWVLPLGLYLLSFVICFDSPRWYVRPPFLVALFASGYGVCWAMAQGIELALWKQVGIYSGALFICCMVCHGELYRLKPAPRHLTSYYLMIATGGALGGLFVAVAAPLLFTDFYELHLGLVLCWVLFTFVLATEPRPAGDQPVRWFAQWPWRALVCLTLFISTLLFGNALWTQVCDERLLSVCKTRNFYGVLTVFEYSKDEPEDHYFMLQHGVTMHGLQFAELPRSSWPTTYYGKQTGIGMALDSLPVGRRRIGLVGLGTGTVAAYAQAGDRLRVYEINPDVQRLARSYFSYLPNCLAKTDVVLGDARLSLENEPPQNFDLLTLDAFTSDAIPVHLLTKEAFEIYARHMQTNGIIAVHISNQHLNLEPVVINLARHFDYELAKVIFDETTEEWWENSSTWILLSHDRERLHTSAFEHAATYMPTNTVTVPLWTDDFASLYQILL